MEAEGILQRLADSLARYEQLQSEEAVVQAVEKLVAEADIVHVKNLEAALASRPATMSPRLTGLLKTGAKAAVEIMVRDAEVVWDEGKAFSSCLSVAAEEDAELKPWCALGTTLANVEVSRKACGGLETKDMEQAKVLTASFGKAMRAADECLRSAHCKEHHHQQRLQSFTRGISKGMEVRRSQFRGFLCNAVQKLVVNLEQKTVLFSAQSINEISRQKPSYS